MSVPEPVSAQITIDASRFETHRVFYFDRFAIFSNESSYEFHFGFFGQFRELMQGIIVIVAKEVISGVQESFLTYVKQMGTLPDAVDLPPCRLHPPCEVIGADIIGLARHQATGELMFHAISWKVAIDRAQSADNKPLPAVCVAILRCTPELQRRWILALYENSENKA